jgi:enoyl-[acyl-carrier protein] reductase/trans-2-enoyl-CoA reductase (NAD+)
VRLFYDKLYSGRTLELDEEDRIRMDDFEMDPEVQEKVARLWNEVVTENLYLITDARGYRDEFFLVNGFEVPGVDYEADVDLTEWASL